MKQISIFDCITDNTEQEQFNCNEEKKPVNNSKKKEEKNNILFKIGDNVVVEYDNIEYEAIVYSIYNDGDTLNCLFKTDNQDEAIAAFHISKVKYRQSYLY